ncbi:MAG TPA: metallophosphoesterase [Vicinamibacterales bacterium]
MIVFAAITTISCGADKLLPGSGPGPIGETTVLLAAGDIGMCGSIGAAQTGEMLGSLSGTILAVGDMAYLHGTADDFTNCYDPVWGPHKARTKPTPGNHEYETAAAQPYFDYFGPLAGPAGLGYYSFKAGDWLVLSINSNIPVGNGTAQIQWIRSELTANTSHCALAFFHHPLYSSGPNGDNARLAGLWQLLYDMGVDVIVNGHEHLYERYGPMTPDGQRNDVKGIRQFIVGTGGAGLYTISRLHPVSEVQVISHGLLKLTLSSQGYQWEFLQVSGVRGDYGQDVCH